MWGDYKRFSDEYWINEDDDKEPDSDDDCDCDLELLRPPAVTTLGLLSQAARTEGVKIKTWMIIEGTVGTGQCDTLKIGIAFSADGSNCLLRLIARQFRTLYNIIFQFQYRGTNLRNPTNKYLLSSCNIQTC
ncbi:hypothetical protein CAPTEDRAFT_213715 [Capitella teleta]|uniref:Uncharacterized protein n=1 Tax=Capitella teleta TaxID=283909 RepID=R7UHK2_CAPTE|nr:hypothetical protein CAPTEDRAFT_213715 [Capitella teleta]|eukprot:ELU05685.1 hypothetical protein CAPTEDRAFT_213715 [Capitella teleta]